MEEKTSSENQYSQEELDKIDNSNELYRIFSNILEIIIDKKGKSKIRHYIDAGHKEKKCFGYTIFFDLKSGTYDKDDKNVKLRGFILALQQYSGLGCKGKIWTKQEETSKNLTIVNPSPEVITSTKSPSKDIPFHTTFVCYLWKDNKLDFAILEIKPNQNQINEAGFTILGTAYYKIFNEDGSEKFTQEGPFGKSNSFFYTITKSTKGGSVVSFFSIRHKESIFDREKKYFDGTFTSDMRGEKGSSGLVIIERRDDAEIYINKLLKTEIIPSPYIINYLFSKRIIASSDTVYESLNKLPSKDQVNKLTKIKGVYEMYFFNTRLEGIEKAILVVEESGLIRIIQNQDNSNSYGFITASDKALFYCNIDYDDSLKVFQRKIVFREITYKKVKYFHGILSGRTRSFEKPFSSRIRIKKIKDDIDEDTINSVLKNDKSKPQIYLFNDTSFTSFIKEENSLLKFLFGFIDGINDGLGFFGDSLAYFNDISKKNFELKKVNHITIDQETTKLLANTHWQVLYYDNIETHVRINGQDLTYVFEGIAKGILSFDNDCHLHLEIGSKDLTNKIDIYDGFITNQKENILFAELMSFENNTFIEKTRIILNFRIFKNDAVGIYTRIENEKIITAYVVFTRLIELEKKDDNISFLQKGTDAFNTLDKPIKKFLFSHSKNAISLITSFNFKTYQSNNINKRTYKPYKIYLTSPASFVWEKENQEIVFNEIKIDIIRIQQVLELKLQNINESVLSKKVFCAFSEYSFADLEKGIPNIYNLQDKMRECDVLIMIFHSKLNDYIGQTSMLIEFGWANILKIPVYIYQMKGTKLPNIMYSASKIADSNVKIMTHKQHTVFSCLEEIIEHINDNM